MKGQRTGRTLPETAYSPGVGPRPDLTWLTDPDPWSWAADLFDAQQYWEAHEVWESMWLTLPRESPRARFLQGLLLLSAALVKSRAGHPEGANALFLHGVEALEDAIHVFGDEIDGIDLLEVVAMVDGALHGGPPPHLTLVR